VTRCGRICFGRRKINLSTAFAGQTIGVREIDDQIWLVSFLEYDLGYFDEEMDRVEPGPSPFMPDKVLTMCPEQDVNHVTVYGLLLVCQPADR
jgi:putative transposase